MYGGRVKAIPSRENSMAEGQKLDEQTVFQELPIIECGWWTESKSEGSGEGDRERTVNRGLIIKGFTDLAKEFGQFSFLQGLFGWGCHSGPRLLGLSSHTAQSETEFPKQVVSLGSDPGESCQSRPAVVWVCFFHMQRYITSLGGAVGL